MGKQQFISLIKDGAIEGYLKYNILPSLTMAQAILESGWGKSHIEQSFRHKGRDGLDRENRDQGNKGIHQRQMDYRNCKIPGLRFLCRIGS